MNKQGDWVRIMETAVSPQITVTLTADECDIIACALSMSSVYALDSLRSSVYTLDNLRVGFRKLVAEARAEYNQIGTARSTHVV